MSGKSSSLEVAEWHELPWHHSSCCWVQYQLSSSELCLGPPHSTFVGDQLSTCWHSGVVPPELDSSLPRWGRGHALAVVGSAGDGEPSSWSHLFQVKYLSINISHISSWKIPVFVQKSTAFVNHTHIICNLILFVKQQKQSNFQINWMSIHCCSMAAKVYLLWQILHIQKK